MPFQANHGQTATLDLYASALEFMPATSFEFEESVKLLEWAFQHSPIHAPTPHESAFFLGHLDELVYMAQHMTDLQPCVTLLRAICAMGSTGKVPHREELLSLTN